MDTPNLEETLPTPAPRDEEDHIQSAPLSIANPASYEETRPSVVASRPEAPLDPEPEPGQPGSGGPEEPQTALPRRRGLPTWLILFLVGFLTLSVIAGMAAYGGYRSGLYEHDRTVETQNAGELDAQFLLAMQDLDEQRYELARQRFEWLIRQNPNYPGVTDMLAVIYLELNTTATPTVMPTPTLTPTPDLRSVEELYVQSQMAMAANDWDAAIETLLKLRKSAPDYHTIEVDGMLYVALRNRGVEKIKNANLESGTYDLALAERFGPVDAEAKNYRQWAEWYITGASFWGVDWRQAVDYFEDLALSAPYLSDSSGWTSIERFRRALLGYGDLLASQEDWCAAVEQYQRAQEVSEDPEVEPTATYSDEQCATGGEEGETDSDNPEQMVPTEETPTVTPDPNVSP